MVVCEKSIDMVEAQICCHYIDGYNMSDLLGRRAETVPRVEESGDQRLQRVSRVQEAF